MLIYLLFLPLALIFINFFHYGFFRSAYLAHGITMIVVLLLQGAILGFAIFTFVFSVAYAIFNHSQINDVRFGLSLAILSYFLPFIGIPLYLLIWKKLSRKIEKIVKTDSGTITFHNNNQ